MELHKVQTLILRELLFRPNARFTDLNLSGLSNDHFSYHIRVLVDAGYVKKDTGRYILTTQGKKYCSTLDTDTYAFEKAWKADAIRYKRGSYRFWTKPVRVKTPATVEIYGEVMKWFKELYVSAVTEADKGKIINEKAIQKLAHDLDNNALKDYQINFLCSFALPLAVKRATDIASLVRDYNSELFELKEKQATLFGECQSNITSNKISAAVNTLVLLADIELNIRNNIFR